MSADIAKAILSRRFVFVLKINILPDIDEDSFDKFDEENVDINSFWYNNISTVGQIRLLQFILKSIFLNIFLQWILECREAILRRKQLEGF